MKVLKTTLFALLLFTSATLAADQDGVVEWDGLSHLPDLDTRPLCPVDGQAFTVRMAAYAGDLTSVRVQVDDGAVQWIDAAPASLRGPYEIWEATVPATVATSLLYWFELSDGADIDYLSASGVFDEVPVDGGFVVDFDTLIHAPVGATPIPGGGVVFKVWSPDRTSCHVRGEFNGWSTADPMAKVGEHFVLHVPEAEAGDMYKYFFQNSHWNTDARARRLNPGDNYNAFVIDPFAYDWQVDDFQVPWFEEMVVYQLHIGTFAGRNDPYGAAPFPAGYPEVAARAGHLAELGVNAVMFNPFTEFPGDHSAGYNPVSAWAPEWIYGTPDELKQMVDALHAEGIAVLLDIVWNHFSFSDNFLWWYDGTQIYFDDPAVETPWGSQADFDRQAVREYFIESARMWLEEYRLDGFRMDATSYMNIPPQEASGWSLMQWLNYEMDRRWIDKIAIAEQLPDNSWITRPGDLGGAGFDSQYYDEFTDRLREEIFDASFGDPEMWKIRNIVNGGGEYLSGRYVTNYLELHDEAWPTSGGQRMVKSIDGSFPHDDIYARGRIKLGQGLVFTAPGIPAMLMGSEWLEDTDFGTDSANRIDWSKKDTYRGTFDYFRDLIGLRKSIPALHADAPQDVFHLNESGNLIAFQRWAEGEVVVVVANFSNSDYTGYRLGLPQAGIWHEAINSQDAAYDGNGMVNAGDIHSEALPYDGFDQSAMLDIPQMGLLVLRLGEQVSVPDQGETASPARLIGAWPNPFNPWTSIAFDLPHAEAVRLEIFDADGRRVATLVDGTLNAGRHEITWQGRSDAGEELASGVYLMKLSVSGESESGKLVLLR